jgi:hypothetical protein
MATRLAAFLDRTKLFGAPQQALGPVGHRLFDQRSAESMRDSPPARGRPSALLGVSTRLMVAACSGASALWAFWPRQRAQRVSAASPSASFQG